MNSDYKQLSDFRATGAVTSDDLVYSQNVTSGIEQKTTVRQLMNFIMAGFSAQRQSLLVQYDGQPVYTGLSYTPGLVNVWVMGIRLSPSMYQAIDGLTLTIINTRILAKLKAGMSVDLDSIVSMGVSDSPTTADVQALYPSNQSVASALTGTELMSVQQSSGLFQTTLTTIANWIVNIFQGFIQSGTGAVPRTIQSKLGDFVSVKDFGAVGDGVTDDTTAIQNALNINTLVYAPPGNYLISSTLNVNPGCTLMGAGSGNYSTVGVTDPTITQFTVASNTATTGINLGSRATARHFLIQTQNASLVVYSNATYPAGTGNASYGINVGYGAVTGGSAYVSNVTAYGFSQAGFYLGTTSWVDFCMAVSCLYGYETYGTDGFLRNSVGMFCINAGAILSESFWNVSGCRFEWNAQYGLMLGGEGIANGNLFDRNGYAGLQMISGAWGQCITGNYFSRNGAGGDGTLGRWAWSTPGTPSYLAVPAGLSCHIEVDYQHSATVVGNRFRPGTDDSGGGSISPQFVVGSQSSAGATPGIGALNWIGNMGDNPDNDIIGYNPNFGGVTGSGAVVGGTDTGLSFLSTGMQSFETGVSAPIYQGASVAGQVSSVVIKVPTASGGVITLQASVYNQANLSQIYFATNAVNGGFTTSINNVIGTAVSSVTVATDPSDSRWNLVSITLASAYFCQYSVVST